MTIILQFIIYNMRLFNEQKQLQFDEQISLKSICIHQLKSNLRDMPFLSSYISSYNTSVYANYQWCHVAPTLEFIFLLFR